MIIQHQAHDNIKDQQHRYKNRYDKQRSDPHYEINDLVLIKIHGKKTKLDPKYSITQKLLLKNNILIIGLKMKKHKSNREYMSMTFDLYLFQKQNKKLMFIIF